MESKGQRTATLESARSLAILCHDYEGALAKLVPILQQDASDQDALMLEGHILDLQARYSEALARYERVLDLNPENVAALIDTADSYSYLERYQEALEKYDMALHFLAQGATYCDPLEEYQAALLGKLLALRNLGEFEKAVECEADLELMRRERISHEPYSE